MSAFFPTFAASAPPALVAAFPEGGGTNTLVFAWADAASGSGETLLRYQATLYADVAMSEVLAGPVLSLSSMAQFSGVAQNAGFLLVVVAVAAANGFNGDPLNSMEQGVAGYSDPLLLLTTSPAAPAPASLGLSAPLTGPAAGESEDAGIMVPLRPVYGTDDGMKRWARIVSFGEYSGQVGSLDVAYYLMAASDEADALFAARYMVPLRQYNNGRSFVYPPGLPVAVEQLAAAYCVMARKSSLTEQESGYASKLMGMASDKLERMAKGTLLGQTALGGVLPRVYNAAPRQFSMPGDPAGLVHNPITGSSDMRSFRQSALPYSQGGWRYGYSDGYGY